MVELTDHSPQRTSPGAGLTAALEWWRGAGVDYDYQDDPRNWLPQPVAQDVTEAPTGAAFAATSLPAAPARPEPPLIKVGGDPATWPQRLEDFAAWWLTEPSLDHGIVMERIAPRGPARADLMVLVEHPEATDRTELLSGDQGQLLDAFLRAAQIDPAQVFRASALPRHTPMPDWAALNAAGLGAVTAQHIALAAPQRLIVLGSNISPLLGHDPTNSAESLRGINQEGRTIPVLVAPGLDEMLQRPRRKAVLWQRWLDWTGESKS